MDELKIKEIEKEVEGYRVVGDWEKVIELKITLAKNRNCRKRGWIKLTKSWLTSSINYRMSLDEQAVFSKVLVMGDEYGPVPGLISDNDFRPMPYDYLAHQACCSVELFKAVVKKSIEDDAIFENSHGLFLTHFDDYQATEYDRQKIYRPPPKKDKDFKGGNYGHRVASTAAEVKEIKGDKK